MAVRLQQSPPRLLCVQVGAREHYAVPRALAEVGANVTLFTDQWYSRSGLVGRMLAGKTGRYHADFHGTVVAASGRFLLEDLVARFRRRRGWNATLVRNIRFRSRLSAYLSATPGDSFDGVFAYSYTAMPALEWARRSGVPGVLGQIDPGRREDEIVRAAVGTGWTSPPETYWKDWIRETQAASHIVVNSMWSRDCLVESGVSAEKLVVIPLAYDVPVSGGSTRKELPARFSSERPLRLLFLGQVIARKGVGPLLEAMECLRKEGEPVELDIVGGGAADLMARAVATPGCRVHGWCARSATGVHYTRADAFVLPTLSDGFALTQLEALSAGLPLLVSRFCGDVVQPGVNGERLERVDAGAIVEVVRRWIREAGTLRRLAAGCSVSPAFSLASVGCAYLDLINRESWEAV